ncbi:MAG: 3-deoxy-D-manno-octulosonic acid transferase [Chitinophagaceae bacterium]|nr:3-deoxy-D-manno-octulosonic acid transferase [Chitinophagaceae bacterium]
MIIFYHLFLWIYRAGVFVVAFFNPKARLWIKGRVNVFSKVRRDLLQINSPIVWMHAASLGEFEQGKPVLKKILEKYPGIVPVISFFSPSGYEVVKEKNEFKYVYYLPMDSVVNAHLWMHFVKPDLVLWIKYEYWYFYIRSIYKKGILLLMVSGIYQRQQPFFKWYGSLYRKMLKSFTHFFVQNRSSQKYLSTLVSRDKITISGDTRCDRVIEIAEDFHPVEKIEEFIGGKITIVCGSTWEADEDVWSHFVQEHQDIRFIIAPHEIDKENIEFVKKRFKKSVLYSQLLDGYEGKNTNCLIIDNVGILSRLYHYATITYVGGGFGDDGLHNILEAAVYGKPVLFGPVIYKNFEASEMMDAGGALSVDSAVELEKVVTDLLTDQNLLDKMCLAAKQYVYSNAGASEKIVDYINRFNLLNRK